MKQIVQDIGRGKLQIRQVPQPLAKPGQVLIANACSLISAGTEKMALELARMSIVGKARQRPDAVRRVIEKLNNEGLISTVNQVIERLDEPMPMGYSSAGTVIAVGAGVQEFKPGDRAASNGPHAGVVSVPRHLCARVPENVPLDQAAFTVLGAIALHGVRLSKLVLGENAFVIGLGLVGQITVAILRAAGIRVIGTDPDPQKCQLAIQMGADNAQPNLQASDVIRLSRNLGADAVLICASTPSHQPVTLAGDAVRQKGRVVAVGAVGLDLPRRAYYFKEAEIVVSCSYGPGRYDYQYEDAGRDYPAPYVRWTEQRNLQAVLDLLAAGKLDLAPLISHRYSIENAMQAYELIESGQPHLGVIIEFPDYDPAAARNVITLKSSKPPTGKINIGCLGAGGFARLVLLPALRSRPSLHPLVLASAGGLSAGHSGKKLDFDRAAADEDQVIADPEVQAVFIITRHHQHAGQVIKALRQGKHVFVEKPLALTLDELADIETVLIEAGPHPPLLMVGYNRRFSPAARDVKDFFRDIAAPLTVSVRMNAGEIPAEHWTQDELAGGGRIIGEACHAIDLAVYLTGSTVARVFAESVGGAQAPAITDDQCFITLRHHNGSVSNVAYLAGGDKALPKERVEVFGGGRAAIIDDFRSITRCADGKVTRSRAWQQDKGHRAEIEAFADTLQQGGEAPISWAELRSSAAAAVLAVRSIREGIPFEVPGA